MNDDMRRVLETLEPLRPEDQNVTGRCCKICGGRCVTFDYVDFNKYCDEINPHKFGYSDIRIKYIRCEYCGLIFTNQFDDWSDLDWRRFVYNQDYIKVDKEYADIRPTHVANDFARRLRGAERARILDYGSGAGVFANRMRERGFANIACYDPFASPQGPEGLFDIITCFEVMEHSPDPLRTLGDMVRLLAVGGCILFSQTPQPDDILSRRGGWWYLAPRNGHVSLYAEETLVTMGRAFGLKFYRGDTVFGYAPRQVSPAARLGLNSIGPSFESVRLYPPSSPSDVDIAFPTPRDIWWHKVEWSDGHQCRWTGSKLLSWRVSWEDVSLLQLRVPYLAEARPGFAEACTLRLDGVACQVKLSRGEIIADFEVDGRNEGLVQLHTPEPVDDPLLTRKIGLALRLRPNPGLDGNGKTGGAGKTGGGGKTEGIANPDGTGNPAGQAGRLA